MNDNVIILEAEDISFEEITEKEMEFDMGGFLPDATKAYMNSISKIPLLTFEQEQILGAKILEGNEDAKEELISSNLRAMSSISFKIFRTFVNSFARLIKPILE